MECGRDAGAVAWHEEGCEEGCAYSAWAWCVCVSGAGMHSK